MRCRNRDIREWLPHGTSTSPIRSHERSPRPRSRRDRKPDHLSVQDGAGSEHEQFWDLVFPSLVIPIGKLELTTNTKLRCAKWDRSCRRLKGRGSYFTSGKGGRSGSGLWEIEYGGDEGTGRSGTLVVYLYPQFNLLTCR